MEGVAGICSGWYIKGGSNYKILQAGVIEFSYVYIYIHINIYTYILGKSNTTKVWYFFGISPLKCAFCLGWEYNHHMGPIG